MFDLCDCQSSCPTTTCGQCDIRDDKESKYDQCLRICKDEYNSDCYGITCEQYCIEPTNFNENDDGFACIISCDTNTNKNDQKNNDKNKNGNGKNKNTDSSTKKCFYDSDKNKEKTKDNCAEEISPEEILNSGDVTHENKFARDQWRSLKPLLHPTQPEIGYAWAIRKSILGFDTEENAQIAMNPVWSDKWPNLNATDLSDTEETIPCIIGPTGPNTNELTFYVIDSHHTLSALDYSGHDQTIVYIHVEFDYRMYSYDEFVAEMIATYNCYLYAQHGTKKELPTLIDFSELPETFDFNINYKALGDNTWRSLAGYSRKVIAAPYPFDECFIDEGEYSYCMRPWMRICGTDGSIPFYEFMWAFFYVDACYLDTKYWDGTLGNDPFNTFIQSYENVLDKYYDENGDWIDLTSVEYQILIIEWLNVASNLVPLARGAMTAEYQLIDYFRVIELPGRVEGTEKVDRDPTCDAGEDSRSCDED
eukprot:542614_1